jgi:hypothetical protein
MPLATKDNAIIVKDGKLAENCDCCGGWYCYKDCSRPTCPCEYDGEMPPTLRAQIDFSFPSTVYLPRIAAPFGFDEYNSYRVTSADASAASISITLSRVGSTCSYSAALPSSRGDISVTVGARNEVLDSNLWQCSDLCYTGISLNSFTRWIACKLSPTQYGPAPLRNAASLSYPIDSFVFIPGFVLPNTYVDLEVTPIYHSGFQFVLNTAGVDVSPCVLKPSESIYGRWVFDLLYTDTSGPNLSNQTLSRVCSVTVSD